MSSSVTEGDPLKSESQIPLDLTFKRRLVAQVKKHRVLYDNTNKEFLHVARKQLAWQQISKYLQVDAETCKTTWVDIRYDYQRYVRRLREFFRNRDKKVKRRPVMELETELIFLYRFIANRSHYPLPYKVHEAPKKVEEESQKCQKDDDLILVEEPVVVIVIDEEDESKRQKLTDPKAHKEKEFVITREMRKLVEILPAYPELYDTLSPHYNDYKRKGIIWNAIANETGDKATKLMKSWIYMQTRYEWEIARKHSKNTNKENPTKTSELVTLLDFLRPYILCNPNTVFKQSYYLKLFWQEPIENFKNIYNLLAVMKKYPQVVAVTDRLLNNPHKDDTFFSLWYEISNLRGSSLGQCETTWLILRAFYWELMSMRQHSYQLTDKWYFEGIISDLYAQTNAAVSTAPNRRVCPDGIQTALEDTMKVFHLDKLKLGKNQRKRNRLQQDRSLPSGQNVLPTLAAPRTLPTLKTALNTASEGVQTTPRPPQMPLTTAANVPNGLAPGPLSNNLSGVATSLPLALPLPLPVALPTRTKETPISLPPPPVLPSGITVLPCPMNTATTTASVTTTTALSRMSPPKITIVPTPCGPTTGFASGTATSAAYLQPLSPIPKACIASAPATSLMPVIASATSVVTSIPLTGSVATATSATNATNATTASCETTPGPLPKITGVVSLLNPNEILIELIASASGNHLVVHGPPLSGKYSLSMPKTARFIREVMAIPLLHNKQHMQPQLINTYWEHIAAKFELPPHICRACWNFLAENFNHFPQIAPLDELMRPPFETTLNVWQEANELFQLFDQHAVAMGWMWYQNQLPELMECISSYSILYKDVAKEPKDTAAPQLEMEATCVWRTIRLRFPDIKDTFDIWSAFKNVFCQYLNDLEFGIDQKWPQNWWRVLAKLKFLLEARYHNTEPFYYITSNKMLEEIERCNALDLKAKKPSAAAKATATATAKVKQNTVLSLYTAPERLQSISRVTNYVETYALLSAIQRHPLIYETASHTQKIEAWKEVAEELNISLGDCLFNFSLALRKYRSYKVQDPVNRCRMNQRYYKKFDEIFRSAKPRSRKINIKTPHELNQSVEGDSEQTEAIFPERYVSEINMSTCPSDLVVKNWIFAIGNLHSYQDNLPFKLRKVLEKYFSDGCA